MERRSLPLCGLALFSVRLLAADIDIDKACPAAVSEQLRLQTGHSAVRDALPYGRPALRKLLLDMARADQAVRDALMAKMRGGESPDEGPMNAVDAKNLGRFKHIIAQDGFPTAAMVGLDGVKAAFLLVQHCTDLQFQAGMLSSIRERLSAREIDGDAFALLTDRVLIRQGKKQRYGSQFQKRDGQWLPDPIERPESVDARRRALGMLSMANYTCILQALYGAG